MQAGAHRYIGCAGWSLWKEHAGLFAADGTHLQRYASRFNAVEINSSFYRPHRRETYARWAASVPDEFRFAVKAPREITHFRRLQDSGGRLSAFLDKVGGLTDKLGPLLFQLPPSLAYDAEVVRSFLKTLRESFGGAVAWEPRHPTWFTTEADTILEEYCIARVAADPAVVPQAAEPGGWRGLAYYRLHGSPKIYYSAYAAPYLVEIADKLSRYPGEAWCIFDNTALGEATTDALQVISLLQGQNADGQESA